ncbi:MAG: FAD-binding domain-containing protein [Planctomycetota bacterium]
MDKAIQIDTSSREAIQSRLSELFPAAAERDDRLSPHLGGLAEAKRRLDAVRPEQYAKTRNHLDGAVTQLSPYIRHRVMSLSQVRDAALMKVSHPRQAGKLVQELAWHDFFQRVYAAVGEEGVWHDLEPWKTGHGPSDYADELPAEIEAGETGIDWVDHFAWQLSEEGWLHNHARMWLACYVVHVRRIRWQAGAKWFLRHLVDGDPASNNLSWQWVASTFSSKPYFMNRGNVVKNVGDLFPPHAKNDPTDKPYDQLAAELFRDGLDATQDTGEGLGIDLKRIVAEGSDRSRQQDGSVTWVHEDMLRPDHPAVEGADAAVFVFDDEATTDVGMTLKPLGFVVECLADLPNVTLLRSSDFDGSVAAAVRAFAEGRPVVTGQTPSGRRRAIGRELDTTTIEDESFVELEGRVDLKRFSRYWRSAQKALQAAGHA